MISANSTLACSFGDNFYANIRNADISSFVLGRAPDASRKRRTVATIHADQSDGSTEYTDNFLSFIRELAVRG